MALHVTCGSGVVEKASDACQGDPSGANLTPSGILCIYGFLFIYIICLYYSFIHSFIYLSVCLFIFFTYLFIHSFILVRILLVVTSYPIFSHHEPFIGANTH